jgi:hypothetical protein
MKIFIAGLCIMFSLILGITGLNAQKKAITSPINQVDTRIDNIGYWQQCAKAGLVTVQPESRVTPPQFNGTRVFNNKGILIGDSPDIPVDTTSTTQSENSVVVKSNDNKVLLNSNNATPNPSTGSVYGTSYLTSSDGGETWGGIANSGPGGSNSGDPAACINLAGRYFIGYIDNAYGQSVSFSDNDGLTWTVVKVGICPSGYSSMLDKNNLTVDNSPTSPFKGNLYDGWTSFGGSDDSYVCVSRSNTNGVSWEPYKNVSDAITSGAQHQGVNLRTGPNGEVYALFAVYESWPNDEGAMGLARSLDGGVTWLPATRIISNIRGIRNTGVPENMRVNSFPSMAVDLSNGPDRGAIYVVWTNHGVPGINTGSDIDVYMIKSMDNGITWSAPRKVNQDASGMGKTHYLGWVTVDQANGIVSVVFYDNRNCLNNQAQAWMAYSLNGGDTFQDMQVSDVTFTPTPIPHMASKYMGDYLGIAAYDGMAYPVWTDNRSGHCRSYVSPISLLIPKPQVIYNSNSLNDTTFGNGNGKMDFNETELLGLEVINTGSLPADSVWVTVSSASPYIQMIDSTEYYGNFDVNQTKTVLDAYKFAVSDSIPNDFSAPFLVKAVDKNDSVMISSFTILSHAPAVNIISMNISDPLGNNNGRLDPGETATVNILTQNPGNWDAVEAISELFSSNPYVTIISPVHNIGTLSAGQSVWVAFDVKVSPYAAIGSAVSFQNYAHSLTQWDRKTWLVKIGLIVEDWETGDFTKFAWQKGGDAEWKVTDSLTYEKIYSAQSGSILNNQTTSIFLNYNVMYDDSISFFKRVSSLKLSDMLNFYIDNSMVGQWSGKTITTFDRVAYPVLVGPHTFKWEYYKGFPGSDGADAAWVDFIVFPPQYLTTVNAGENGSACENEPYQLHGMAASYDSLLWTSSGTGTFSNPRILDPLYTASSDDLIAGSVNLTLRAFGMNQMDTTNTMTLEVNHAPSAFAGSDVQVCKGTSVFLEASTATPSATIQWSTSGDGIFDNTTALHPIYTPGQNDNQTGLVSLILHVTGDAPCPVVSDTTRLSILPLPVVNIGVDTAICGNSSISLNATIPNPGSYLWTPGGSTTPVITVDSTGVGFHSQTYKVMVTDVNGCVISDSIRITFKNCTGIEELKNVSFRLYPNPNNGKFTVEINTLKKELLTIRIINNSGEEQYAIPNFEVNGRITKKIEIGNVSQGTYFFELTNGKETAIKKVVIQK